jgi:hypothetical protein
VAVPVADSAGQGSGRGILFATYVVLLAIGVLLGVIGSFLVPLRLTGGLEGLSVVLAVLGNAAVGSLGGLGTRTMLGAILPTVGWFVVVGVLLLVAPGGDFVFVGKLPADPGVVWVGNLFLLLGVVGGAIALFVTFSSIRSARIRSLRSKSGYTEQGNAPTPQT